MAFSLPRAIKTLKKRTRTPRRISHAKNAHARRGRGGDDALFLYGDGKLEKRRGRTMQYEIENDRIPFREDIQSNYLAETSSGL